MEENERAQNVNGDGNVNGVGRGMATGMETLGRTQDGKEAESGDGNESNSGERNVDKDGNGNRNEDRIVEGGGEANKCKKPHKTCRRHVGNRRDLGGNRK